MVSMFIQGREAKALIVGWEASVKQIIIVGLLISGATGLAWGQDGSGWFNGISAAPYTIQWDTELAPEGSALSSHLRSEGLGGTEMSQLSRSLVLGSTGTIPINERWSLSGSLASIRNQGLNLQNASSSAGLYDALPYTMTGLGMHYDMTHSLRFQGGLDHYQLNYNRINGSANIDLLSLGLRYGF